MYVHIKLLHCSIFTPCVPWLHVTQVDRMADSGLVFECTQWWSVTLVHRFASYIATAGRNQKLGLEEVDVCYESINGGWSPVLSKKSQLGWMTTSYTLSYSGRNNLTHQSNPSWSVGDQLPRLAKRARDIRECSC